ncbi:MAG TPA: APC family permease [Gemmatimonadaceae bacterium]|nr:APC family permease [Gemmatimonadaceae bacterium]
MTDRPSIRAEAGESQLVRAIGTWGLAASIVNVTVGGGIFRLPGSPDVSGRLGAAAPVAYLACAVVMGLVVLCIAQAGSRVSLTGGPYAYVEATFGRYVGFLVGVLLWVIGATAIPGVAGLFADAGASLVPAIGTLGGRALFLGLIFAAVTWINVRGVKQGTRLNVVLTVAKLVPLALLLVGGLMATTPSNLRWQQGAPAVSDLARASVILVFAYAGVESALVPSGEVRDSVRTVPRAVLLAMGIVTLLYVGLQVAAQGVLGTALPGSATPLADAAGRVFGSWGVVMISAGFMVSAFGYLSGMMLAVPRALFAFARDGILPRRLAAVHPRFHTPWLAIVAQSTLCWVLAVLNSFETLAIIANVSAALVYIGCAGAAWKLSRQPAPRNADAFRIPGGAVVPLLAIIALAFLLSAVTLREWSVLVIVLVVASLLYYAATRTREERILPDAS